MKQVLTALASVAVTGLVTAGCSASEASPSTAGESVTEAVFFGDSLTDAGSYGYRFTTNPGWTWAQHVAANFGQSTEPNIRVTEPNDIYTGVPPRSGPGGPNYAQGGARANLPYSSVSDNREGVPQPTSVQVQSYLTQHGDFRQSQLATLFVGTNDVAYHYDLSKSPIAQLLRDGSLPTAEVMASERARVEEAATAAAHTASDIVEHGIGRLMVFTVFDLARAPWFRTEASRHYIRDLTDTYNAQLLAELPDDSRVEVFDTNAFLDDLDANRTRYELTHTDHEDACRLPDLDYCDISEMVSPEADRTYVFAGSLHFTTKAHELLAQRVLGRLKATV